MEAERKLRISLDDKAWKHVAKEAMYAESELHAVNNNFKKRNPRKWTWISLNMQTRSAIDFILLNDQTTFPYVDIISRFEFDSDHRVVMAKIRLKNISGRLSARQKLVQRFSPQR
ncbi:hypothetical protein V3C99_011962 [Haemonchus contortus]